MARQLQIFDYAMNAGGSFQLPVGGAYFRIISTTGNVSVTGDTFGKLGPISRGQGLENTEYGRLTIKDESGSANAGTILVSEANFIDQTLYGSIALASAVALDAATLAALEQINVRPEAPTSFYGSKGALAANTPELVFSAAANTGGAILLAAAIYTVEAAGGIQAFIANAAAPATTIDGDVVHSVLSGNSSNNANNNLQIVQNIPAGKALYFISDIALTVTAQQQRTCRFKLL